MKASPSTRTNPGSGIPWKPYSWRRTPWLALAACFGFAISAGLIALVLISSHDKEVTAYPLPQRAFPVSVLLAILVALANLCLAVATSQGYAIAWWLKALRGSKIKELQFDLDVQHSIVAVFKGRRSFDKFMIAALVALAVSIVDGPILQRASSTMAKTIGPVDVTVQLSVANSLLPSTYSGFTVIGSVAEDTMLLPGFQGVSKAYARQVPISLPYQGCDPTATCALVVPGPGLDFSCTDSITPYNFRNLAQAGNSNITPMEINVTHYASQTVELMSTINVTTVYKPDPACIGDLIRRQCILRLAMVGYPITLTNNTAVLSQWRPWQNESTSIPSFSDWHELGDGSSSGMFTMLGGLASVAKSLYETRVNLRIGRGQLPFILTGSGQAGSDYMTSNFSAYSDCTMTWSNPTDDIFRTLRELMFRSAISASPPEATQQLQARSTRVGVVYQSDLMFFFIAVGCMLLQVVLLVALLWGYWRLGRGVSLDAFEIGKALGAPLLHEGSSNSTVDELLEVVGENKVRYGEIDDHRGHSEDYAMPGPRDVGLYQGDSQVSLQQQQYSQDRWQGEETHHGGTTGFMLKNMHTRQVDLAEPAPQAGSRPRLGFREADRVRDTRDGVSY